MNIIWQLKWSKWLGFLAHKCKFGLCMVIFFSRKAFCWHKTVILGVCSMVCCSSKVVAAWFHFQRCRNEKHPGTNHCHELSKAAQKSKGFLLTQKQCAKCPFLKTNKIKYKNTFLHKGQGGILSIKHQNNSFGYFHREDAHKSLLFNWTIRHITPPRTYDGTV